MDRQWQYVWKINENGINYSMTSKCKSVIGLLFSILWLNSNASFSQPSAEKILILGDELYENAAYNAAITEYKRFYFFAGQDSLAFYACYKAGLSYKLLRQWALAEAWLREAFRLSQKKADQDKIRYALAVSLLAVGKSEAATVEWIQLIAFAKETALKEAAALFLAMGYVKQKKWVDAGKTLAATLPDQKDEAVLSNLAEAQKALWELVEKPELKDVEKAKKLSTCLPGAGQIYAGKFWHGVNAFLLNLGTSYLLGESFAEKRYGDSILIYALLWRRYYNGNRFRAEHAANQANQRYHQQKVQAIYQSLEKLVAALDYDFAIKVNLD